MSIRFTGRLQKTGKINIPSSFADNLASVEAVEARLVSSDGFGVGLNCIIQRVRAKRLSKSYVDISITVPSTVRKTLGAPCDIALELAPATGIWRLPVVKPIIGRARFETRLRIHKNACEIEVPTPWLRGLSEAGWDHVGMQLRHVASGVTTTCLARIHTRTAGRKAAIGAVNVPFHVVGKMRHGDLVMVELNDMRFDRSTAKRLFSGDTIDWAATLRETTIAEEITGGVLRLATAYSEPFTIIRKTPARLTAWFLGIYQAEGNKAGETFSVPQKSPQLLRDLAKCLISHLGIARERLCLAGIRFRGSSLDTDEIRARYEHVVGLPMKTITDRSHEETLGYEGALLNMSTSRDFQLMVCAALDRLIDHDVENVTPEVAKAFGLGFLDGDGTVVIDPSIRLNVSGDERELRAAMRLLERGFKWEAKARQLPYKGDSEGMSRYLTLPEAIGLTVAGAFRYSLARARLLYAIEDRWTRAGGIGDPWDRLVRENIQPEILQLRQYVPTLDEAMPGVKGLPYPLAEHGEDRLVRRLRASVLANRSEDVDASTGPTVCYQRQIRDQEAECSPVETISSLAHAHVARVDTAVVKPLILKYEWLGTMGRPTTCYALFSGRNSTANSPYQHEGKEIIGAICMGPGPGIYARNICGEEYRELAICLERGACVHWAPRNAASFLISHACRLAHLDRGWTMFFAYADEGAGEIGTVYQAANWHYLGKGPGKSGETRDRFRRPDGLVVSSRVMRKDGMTKSEAVLDGWEVVKAHQKHKYVWFEGTASQRERWRDACEFPFLPYPKRRESRER
jgi:hypothetical protein